MNPIYTSAQILCLVCIVNRGDMEKKCFRLEKEECKAGFMEDQLEGPLEATHLAICFS